MLIANERDPRPGVMGWQFNCLETWLVHGMSQ